MPNSYVGPLWGPKGRGRYTKREGMYLKFFRMMLPEFCGGSALEVGPGTGQFALLMHEQFEITEYTVLDLETNIEDSVSLLQSHNRIVKGVLSQDYKSLFSQKFDLFVSNVCLPETPEAYCHDLVESMLPNCNRAFVIGGDGGSYDEWIKRAFHSCYSVVTIQPTGYCKTFAISGEGVK